MKRRRFRLTRQSILTLVLLLFSGILYTSCESVEPARRNLQGGTGVGNPFTSSSKLLASACDVIKRCHPDISDASCQKAFLDSEGLDYQIGLPSGYFSSYKSVVEAEEKGLITSESQVVESCAKLVSSLSCDSPQVSGAVASLSKSYWGSPRLFLHQYCASALRVTKVSPSEKFHYIRAEAAGRGDGSDWANACPGFVGACAGNALERGHTYYVASGDYEWVEFNVPGTELITIKKATGVDHGTSVGWQDGYANGPASFPGWEFRSSHWVMDGQGRTSLTSGHGFRIDIPRLSNGCPRNFCNAILLASESTIDRMTFRYVEVVGFGVDSARHLNGLYSVPIDGTSSNIVLSGVSMHEFGEYNGNSPIKLSGGVFNITIDDSAFVRTAARVFSDAGSNNVTVRNSWFEDVADQGVIVSYSVNRNALTTMNWSIHGNVFWESDPARFGVNGIIQCTGGNNCINWQIANNTFANFTAERSAASGIDFYDSGPQTAGNRVINNIWYNSARVNPLPSSQVASPDESLYHDYNMYISSSLSDPPNEPHGSIGNESPFVNAAAGDFRLRAPTRPGLPLAPPLHLSRDNMVRGLDGLWDMGAFEFY